MLDDRAEWEPTFDICWGGVYLVHAGVHADAAGQRRGPRRQHQQRQRLLGIARPGIPHTAYSAAKFAVKGFTEALITDFRLNAPHLRASVVMPGHIGTSIVINSGKVLGRDPKELTEEQIAELRTRLDRQGIDVGEASDEDIRLGMQMRGRDVPRQRADDGREAATVILDGVRADEWRILVGDDAVALDELVREKSGPRRTSNRSSSC